MGPENARIVYRSPKDLCKCGKLNDKTVNRPWEGFYRKSHHTCYVSLVASRYAVTSASCIYDGRGGGHGKVYIGVRDFADAKDENRDKWTKVSVDYIWIKP